MTITMHGFAAIEYAEEHAMSLSKYNDPTEDAREDLTAVYVTDDNGWLDGCPSYEDVFFGEHGGEFIFAQDAATTRRLPVDTALPCMVIFPTRDAAEGLLARLNAGGDWIAPEEVNPEREESRPVYAIAELTR